MSLTTPNLPEIPPPHFPSSFRLELTQDPVNSHPFNTIPRVYKSKRRNAYCTEFERFKHTLTALRTLFPDSPVITYQMPDWIEHRLAMINSHIFELNSLITAAETKAILKREGRWVDVKNRVDLNIGEEVGSWRQRYGAPGECHEQEGESCEWEYRTEDDDDDGSQLGENDSAAGISDWLSVGTITSPSTPFTTPFGSPQEGFAGIGAGNQAGKGNSGGGNEAYTHSCCCQHGYDNALEGRYGGLASEGGDEDSDGGVSLGMDSLQTGV